MKVIVKDEKCIGCGSCVSLTDGEIFDFDEETGKAFAKNGEVTEKNEEIIKNSMQYCPTQAIVEAKEETGETEELKAA